MCRIRQEISSKITEKPLLLDPEKGCEPAQASLTEPKPAVGQRSGALVMLGHTQTQALHESHLCKTAVCVAKISTLSRIAEVFCTRDFIFHC